MLEVDREAALVGVEDEEEHRVEPRHLGPVAPRLLAAGRLDLDDVGAQPAQELRAGGAGFELREVENPHAGQRALGHGLVSLAGQGIRSTASARDAGDRGQGVLPERRRGGGLLDAAGQRLDHLCRVAAGTLGFAQLVAGDDVSHRAEVFRGPPRGRRSAASASRPRPSGRTGFRSRTATSRAHR
jgi:hypothetical protein